MSQTGRVLVADDDSGLRVSTVELLHRSGFLVSAAADGSEALDLLRSGGIDAVVLDVKMPNKDGISVVEEMIPSPPPPAILLVSAYAIDRETRSRLGSKVHRVLRKPVPPQVLLEAVDSAVAAARRARDHGSG